MATVIYKLTFKFKDSLEGPGQVYTQVLLDPPEGSRWAIQDAGSLRWETAVFYGSEWQTLGGAADLSVEIWGPWWV